MQNIKKTIKVHGKHIMFYSVVLFFLLLLAVRSNRVIVALKEAMVLCYQTVIPSLFPFFVLSSLLISGGFAEACARVLSPIMKPLFRVGGAGAMPFVVGLLSGYPTGAGITAELFRNGQINQMEAERLLPFCNNSGPLFLIGAVGAGMLGDVRLGFFLYIIHAVCALFVGLCFRFYKRNGTLCHQTVPFCGVQRKGFLQGFSAAVSGSVSTLLSVCGYILLFAAISAGIMPMLSWLPKGAVIFIKGLLEVTGGTASVVQAGLSSRWCLTLIAFFTGFGGLCVMMQAAGLLSGSGLRLKTYIYGKVLHGVFSAVSAYMLYPLLEKNSQTVLAPISALLPVRLPATNFYCNLWGGLLLLCCIILLLRFSLTHSKR